MKTSGKIEFGDFQTPPSLASEVCALLHRLGETPAIVLEPTVGRGAFLLAAADAFPQAALRGYDINPGHVAEATEALHAAGAGARATVAVQDFFTCDWEKELATFTGPLLLLGNPPWVTNAGVSVVNGTNLPIKKNFQIGRAHV